MDLYRNQLKAEVLDDGPPRPLALAGDRQPRRAIVRFPPLLTGFRTVNGSDVLMLTYAETGGPRFVSRATKAVAKWRAHRTAHASTVAAEVLPGANFVSHRIAGL